VKELDPIFFTDLILPQFQ